MNFVFSWKCSFYNLVCLFVVCSILLINVYFEFIVHLYSVYIKLSLCKLCM